MSQEAQYLAAALPSPVRVLGVRLQPFCVGHALLLQRLGNPFYVGGSPALGDLLLGASLCALPPAEALRLVDTRRFAWLLKARLWWWAMAYTDTQEVLARVVFYRYLTTALTMPQYWVEEQNESLPPGTPWLQRVLLILHLYRTQAEAINTPMAEALWIYCAHWEKEGAIRVMGEADSELQAAALELQKSQSATA